MPVCGSGAAAAIFEPSPLPSRAHHARKIPRISSGSSSSSRGYAWPIIWAVCFAFGVIMGSTTNANRVVIPAGSAAPPAPAAAPAAALAEPKPTPMLRGSKPTTTRTIHGRSEDSTGETRRRKPFARRMSAQREADIGRHIEGAGAERDGETTEPTNGKEDQNTTRQNDDEPKKATTTSATATTTTTTATAATTDVTTPTIAGGNPNKGSPIKTSRLVSRMWRLNEGQWGPNEKEGGEIIAELAKSRAYLRK